MKTGTQMVAEIKAAGYREVKACAGSTRYYMSPNAGGVNYRVLFLGGEPMVYAGDDVFVDIKKLRRVV